MLQDHQGDFSEVNLSQTINKDTLTKVTDTRSDPKIQTFYQ